MEENQMKKNSCKTEKKECDIKKKIIVFATLSFSFFLGKKKIKFRME